MTKRNSAATATTLPADSPSRRTLLTSGAAAALIASTVAALPAADPDAALLALGSDWRRANKTTDAALDVIDKIEGRTFARRPALPEWEAWSGDWQSYIDEHSRVTAVREEIAAEEGHETAEVVRVEASAAEYAIVDQIAAVPARTMAGLLLKIDVSADWQHDHEDITASIIADVEAFAAAHPALTLPT